VNDAGARKARNNGIPFNLTEEFASCFRMNALLPDAIPVEGGSPIPLQELIGPKGVIRERSSITGTVNTEICPFECTIKSHSRLEDFSAFPWQQLRVL
jgi:hypothetical protein